MAEVTEISWAHSTFNPWIGCTKVSPGCDNCYAATLMDDRYGRVKWGAGEARSRTKTWAAPRAWNRAAARSGLPWRVFCASLADVFDNEVRDESRSTCDVFPQFIACREETMKRYSVIQGTDPEGERFADMRERPDGNWVKHDVIEGAADGLRFVEAFLEASLRDARDSGDAMDIEAAQHAHEQHRSAMHALGVQPWVSRARLTVARA